MVPFAVGHQLLLLKPITGGSGGCHWSPVANGGCCHNWCTLVAIGRCHPYKVTIAAGCCRRSLCLALLVVVLVSGYLSLLPQVTVTLCCHECLVAAGGRQ